ncbi:hypothetical protein TNCT_208151 [Trichonephila clavata]|uniref:Uncharacterized protein n=1 Tax=Trichonephila clavata TaxID=2740835 RepID=A0A8X6GUE1_TRICU|nr:hypothetical protein TNCT_208151 [Trichonephila clavata]
MSKNTYYFSYDVGSALIMNIATSMIKGTADVAFAEGMSLVERMNLSKNSFKEVVDLSSMTCLFAEKCLAIATNNFTFDHSLKYQ